jgi:hypothetical protein
LLVPPGDALAMSVPVIWAAAELEKALLAKGAAFKRVSVANAPGDPRLIVALFSAPTMTAESFRLAPSTLAGRPAIGISAPDNRGFVYALLELAERVKFGADPAALAALEGKRPHNLRCRYSSPVIFTFSTPLWGAGF